MKSREIIGIYALILLVLFVAIGLMIQTYNAALRAEQNLKILESKIDFYNAMKQDTITVRLEDGLLAKEYTIVFPAETQRRSKK